MPSPCKHFHLHGLEIWELRASIRENCEVMCKSFDLHLHKTIHNPKHFCFSAFLLKKTGGFAWNKCWRKISDVQKKTIFNQMNMYVCPIEHCDLKIGLAKYSHSIEHGSLSVGGSVGWSVTASDTKMWKSCLDNIPEYFNSIIYWKIRCKLSITTYSYTRVYARLMAHV